MLSLVADDDDLLDDAVQALGFEVLDRLLAELLLLPHVVRHVDDAAEGPVEDDVGRGRVMATGGRQHVDGPPRLGLDVLVHLDVVPHVGAHVDREDVAHVHVRGVCSHHSAAVRVPREHVLEVERHPVLDGPLDLLLAHVGVGEPVGPQLLDVRQGHRDGAVGVPVVLARPAVLVVPWVAGIDGHVDLDLRHLVPMVEPPGVRQGLRAADWAARDAEGSPLAVPVLDRVVHGVAALLPRDRVDGEESRVVLVPAPRDVEAARCSQVAIGRPDRHAALGPVDVDAEPLPEGAFAPLHGEPETAVGHL